MLIKKIVAAAVIAAMSPLLTMAQLSPQDKLIEAIAAIKRNYVDSLADQTLVDAAIKGMFTQLDPHSKYISKAEAQAMQGAMSGNFVGIGIEYMMQNDTVYITHVLPDGPAEKAGLMLGDRILKIDGENVAGKQITNLDILKKIRGANKTTVKLELYRPVAKKNIAYEIVRGPVADRSVTAAYMVDDNTGYMAIRIFSRSTRDEVENSLKKLKSLGMKQLIVDLQGNGGGYVEAALGVADEFLKRDQLVYYTVPRDKGKDYYYASGSGTSWSGKLVFLIDQATASASEILAGAMQDWDRAVLIGRRSFGKGLTQRPIPLSDGSMLELTGARLYTPAGRSLQKPYKGVDYWDDINKRYASGELFKQNNIHGPDSLKTKTLVNKRTVYGGDGITPDVFVPLDTLQEASWLKEVTAAGLVNSASSQLAASRRDQIKADHPDIGSYIKGYKIPKEVLEQTVKAAEAKGLKPARSEKKRLIDLLALQIKAQVAGQLYGGNEGYLRVINTENNSLQEALHLLQDTQLYNNYLQGKTKAGSDVNNAKP